MAEEGGSSVGERWYYSRKEIEENSPSRRDGIDLKKETYLRKSYCTFLQDLGMRLKVPQVTIATAIIFCHRFFLRQSHAKNDRRIIATVCMFLAGKVEETPRPIKDVIIVSYEIIHKKDPAASQRIKQKEVYEQQKELILLGERVVLATLGFDFNVHHPYKPLVEAIKKLKGGQNALAQVAWNFVNDGLRTSLCLQFKPHHIAAGAIFLAGKFLKVKLNADTEKVWWHEFDIIPHQLEEVSNQMLELYEQNKVPPSQTSEVEGSVGGGAAPRATTKAPTANEEHIANSSNLQGGVTNSKPGTLKLASRPDQSYLDNHAAPSKATQNQSDDHASSDMTSIPNHKRDSDYDPESSIHSEEQGDEGLESNAGRSKIKEPGEDLKDKNHGRNLNYKESIDTDKVKAALEKRKARGATARKMDFTDEDDLIERELEDGIELAAESEKIKQERKQSLSKPSDGTYPEFHLKHSNEEEDGRRGVKRKSLSGQDFNDVEGELDTFDDADGGHRSPKSSNRNRSVGSPPDKTLEGRQRADMPASHHHSQKEYLEDRERDHKRHVQESHV
ncbi:Cyclin-T1-5 [Heracleum sosnowskyi]|uniref:Cyclin-T1-5 n=1 Tax=Heracleum sosnowskyi TaxID=360622 RepID=A0AAD8MJ79_9APIA|nr:Cyclin-T1-5 [Heracleum sosnowskyi]